ncbi:GNAT family N-acetyltransferase [Kocuria rhizophila]|uniref:GNAT family N-acetyltransferase n=1 Tax=Kocuria rhizophila TaxID=72000 RepID=UPI0011A5E475|nr:GNAT family N-acetyltransferase [Kocuria rhizophila]
MPEPLSQPKPPQPLHADHLELRPFTRDELETAADAPTRTHFAWGFSSVENTVWARSAIEAGECFVTESEHTRLAVVERASGQAAGTAGFTGPVMDGEFEMESSLVPGTHRRGPAGEALDALVERAFEVPGVRAVRAAVPEDMAPAHRLLVGRGFVRRHCADSEISYRLPRP